MMSFQGNSCDKCTKERMCPEHEIEMLDWEIECNMRRIERLKKEIKNADFASKTVEQFKALKTEREIKNADFASKTANGG
jgi:hypothetical protein